MWQIQDNEDGQVLRTYMFQNLENKTGDRKADLASSKLVSSKWLREDIDLVPWEK